jgi:uncharacterized protein
MQGRCTRSTEMSTVKQARRSVSRTGRSTFDRTIEGIRVLRRENIRFHVISVLSAKNIDAPQEMLDFYLSEGIEDICFNVEESEGEHTSELFAQTQPRGRFKLFLSQFWMLARQSGRIRFIREIDAMLPRVFRSADGEFRNVQVEPLAMLNVDCEGRVSTFSPELLGLKHADYADFIIGNINTDSLDDMLRGPSEGIPSADSNPNRLTLILNREGKITTAVWD